MVPIARIVQRYVRVFLVLVSAVGAASNVYAVPAPGDCDRACLKNALDQYLNAVVTHNPTAAPLFAAPKQSGTPRVPEIRD